MVDTYGVTYPKYSLLEQVEEYNQEKLAKLDSPGKTTKTVAV